MKSKIVFIIIILVMGITATGFFYPVAYSNSVPNRAAINSVNGFYSGLRNYDVKTVECSQCCEDICKDMCCNMDKCCDNCADCKECCSKQDCCNTTVGKDCKSNCMDK